MSTSPLDRATAFRLFARECLRDGEVDDWERRRLMGLASLLRLDETQARQALLEARDDVRASGLVAGAAADPEALYRCILTAALADGVADPAEVRVLLAVRQLLNVDDSTHAALLAGLTPGPGSFATMARVRPDPPPAGSEADLLRRASDLETHVSMLALEDRLGAPGEEAAEAALRASLTGLWNELARHDRPEGPTPERIKALHSCASGLARCGEPPAAALARLAQAEAFEGGAAGRFADQARAEGWLAEAVLVRVHRRLQDGLFTEGRVMLQEALASVTAREVKRQLQSELEQATIPITPPKALGGELALSMWATKLKAIAIVGVVVMAGLHPGYAVLAGLAPFLSLLEYIFLDDDGIAYRLGFTSRKLPWATIRALTSVWGYQTYRGRELRDRSLRLVRLEFALADGSTAALPAPSGARHDTCCQLRQTLLGFLSPVLMRRDLKLLERTGKLVLGDFALDRNGLTAEGGATGGARLRLQWAEIGSILLEDSRMWLTRRGDPGPPIELRTWATPNLFTLHHVLRERVLAEPKA